MHVFLMLLDARGSVVTREEIFNEVWGGAMVGDDSLNRAVARARRIEAETCPGLFEVETIPRTGYRLNLNREDWPGAGNEQSDSRTEYRLTRRTTVVGAVGLAGVAAAGVGIWAPGENPGTHAECLAAMELALEAGGGDVNAIDQNGETALHGAVYRGGNVAAIRFLADRGAKLDVVNSKGWTPVFVADGVEYTPDVLKRYPEAAALLRSLLAERGLPVPPSSQPGR